MRRRKIRRSDRHACPEVRFVFCEREIFSSTCQMNLCPESGGVSESARRGLAGISHGRSTRVVLLALKFEWRTQCDDGQMVRDVRGTRSPFTVDPLCRIVRPRKKRSSDQRARDVQVVTERSEERITVAPASNAGAKAFNVVPAFQQTSVMLEAVLLIASTTASKVE